MLNKIFLLLPVLLISVALRSQQTYVIEANGLNFTPSSLTVNIGDVVQFNAGSLHPVVQVSQSTWEATGSTPLPGGFSFTNGDGNITPTVAGNIYYICSNHIQSGMKGMIVVSQTTDLRNFRINNNDRLYPVPATDYLIYKPESTYPVNEISIIDLTGKPVVLLNGPFESAENIRINISGLNKGTYLLLIRSGEGFFVKKFLKS